MIKLLTLFTASTLTATAWQTEVNVPKKASLKPIPPTQLSYDLTWDGKLKAGTMDLIFGKKDPKYPKHVIAQAYGGATGWAHALFPFQFNYISFLNKKTLRPIMFVGNEVKKSGRTAKQQYRFTSSKVTGSEIKTRDGKTSKSNDTYHYPNSLDLFSGLLQIRSMPLKKNETVVMPFHPVASPYLARIKVIGREAHMGRPAIKMSLSMEKIDTNLKLKEYKKLKSATLWISDDQWRIPLEIRAKVYVGSVRMVLKKQQVL